MGPVCGADDLGQGGEVIANQGHLLDRGEVEVERLQKVGEGLGVLGGGAGEEAQDRFGLLLVAALAAERGQPQKAHRG